MRIKHKTRLISLSVYLLCAISVWQFAAVAYIHAKATLAEWLIEDAWQKTRQGQSRVKPWPWADTWPVARISMAAHNVEQMVLAGASGRTLAFAPGWMKASALPGSEGTSVIAAHRDTHFDFLQQVAIGDKLTVESLNEVVHYQVMDTLVVDSQRYQLSLNPDASDLLLVTCYPFDALIPGGGLRYVVKLQRIHQPSEA